MVMLFNGASNELGHGIGVVLVSSENKLFPNLIAQTRLQNMGIRATCDMNVKKLQN